MKAIIQRVHHASVTVEDKVVGIIDRGLLIFVGIHKDDTNEQLTWIAEKILKLRIFEDEEGKMNRSAEDEGADLLVVSQFTLYGNLKKGTRPSYIEAARPEEAHFMYQNVIEYLRDHSKLKVESGTFGAHMDVQLVNDGPVTIILER
ncbi:MAG: D-aminoacyl-tRNA deacylase [Bacteroidota bacterium]